MRGNRGARERYAPRAIGVALQEVRGIGPSPLKLSRYVLQPSMTDTVLAAVVGAAGAIVVVVATVAAQLGVTRAMIRAERERTREQIAGEEESRRRDRREDRLLDVVSELLAVSDPQAETGADHGKAVALIHRLQLLLDISVPAERSLNGVTNELGQALHAYHAVRTRDIDQKLPETRRLLQAQSAVSEHARVVIRETGSSNNLTKR